MDFDAGRLAEGISRLHEALPIFEAGHDLHCLAISHDTLGQLFLLQGYPRKALQHLGKALHFVGSSNQIGQSVLFLGGHVNAYIACGDTEAALRSLHAARKIRIDHPHDGADSYIQIELLRMQAAVDLARQDPVSAREICAAAAALCVGRYFIPRASTLFIAGRAEHALGNIEEARAHFLVSVLVYRTRGEQTQGIVPLNHYARALNDESADLVLRAIMLPLLRFGFQRELGDALLHHAHVALRTEQVAVARHRARSALSRFEESDDEMGIKRARDFLAILALNTI
ncbi:hypothetical protein EXIGLDRAFT_777863 [Exidia glandulosa HHB12029]|uniref:MalT-like TPR region domain-containing protein n=1 Tax=Exidia glandulosa HHB12029 TaxID=1314781 RepID=A0A165CU16_EXIGL|nr:hypothetical protein EXIGLDRAFT_777863 [Exidia glandulosa HHB12029]